MDTELRVIVGVSDYELGSCNNQCSHTFVWLHNFNNTRSNIIMSELKKETKEFFKDKKYFIIEKYVGYQTERYNIHNQKMYDVETAMRKLLALDTLNEDRERTSYYLQEVDNGMLPLVLTDEVKEEKLEQGEMPF